jgi:hypothetical protein
MGAVVFSLVYRDTVTAWFFTLIAIMSFIADVMEAHISEKIEELKKHCRARCIER